MYNVIRKVMLICSRKYYIIDLDPIWERYCLWRSTDVFRLCLHTHTHTRLSMFDKSVTNVS